LLFITPEITDLINRKINHYTQQFLENMPTVAYDLVNHWNDMKKDDIMKSLAFLFILHKKQIRIAIFPGINI
jgi:hypothetical protein